jgi:glycosyltransferase involved in cell wall biosynthesis
VSRKPEAGRRIVYVQYTNPAAYPPLEHSSRLLADRGWEVLFLGSGSSGQADAFQFPAHPRIAVRRWRHQPRGWRQKAHYSAFSLWVLHQCWRRGAAWIYASDLLACPAALLAARVLGCRVIYHEHDSPPNEGSRFFRRLLAARRQLCQRAELAVLPNARRAEVFAGLVRPRCPVRTVWNCPETREVPSPRPPRRPGEPFTVFYHGSLNEQRLPLAVVQALLELPDAVRLRFAGYTTEGSRDHVDRLLHEAKYLGMAGRVAYAGAPATRDELLVLCRQADVGLAFMPPDSGDLNMQAMTGASNKPFDYLACGLNLLVSDLPDWRAMFVEPGYAQVCHPAGAASIAAAVRWWLDHPAEAEAARVRGRQRILAEWNYERQFAPVLGFLEGVEHTP